MNSGGTFDIFDLQMDVPDTLKSLILALEQPPLSSDTNAFPDKTYPDVGEAIINKPYFDS